MTFVKAAPIQQVMTRFANKHKDKLVYVKEYSAFYLRHPKYEYFTSAFKTKEDIYHFLAGELEMEYLISNSSITRSTFENAVLWLKNKCPLINEFNSSQIMFSDKKVLNVRTLEIADYKPEDFIFYYINCHAPQPKENCPIFKQFLNQILVQESEDGKFSPDPEIINLVQEMFGYYLIDIIEPPTAFFLVGDGANGKSTLLFVLEQLAGGEEFIMSNSIENLTTTPFAKSELRFRRLNVCSEEQSKYLRSDNFKAMVEGTRIHADIKFVDPISFKPKTKHIFATNRIPSFDSIDYGLKRRIKIIPFKRKFLPHETDKTLKTLDFRDSKFFPELPAIISWAMEGARRLINKDYTFSPCRATEESMIDYQNNVSSVAMFIEENFEHANDPDAEFISLNRLFQLYTIWCKRSGKKPFGKNTFIDELSHLKIKSFTGRDNKENGGKTTVKGRHLDMKGETEMRWCGDYFPDVR
ncbi:MAG: phage/plasmid primase, P4 family [Patescibacteria group bacterium]